MIYEVKISQILCILAIFFIVSPSLTLSLSRCKVTNKATERQQFYHGLKTFGDRLYSELARTNSNKNIIISPFSVQTCLAMIRLGAEGKTATEMDKILGLRSTNLAKNYHDILEPYQNSPILKVANKVYVKQGSEIQEYFNEVLTQQFFSSVNAINFANNEAAAKTINTWVESKTNNLIKNAMSPSLLNPSTKLVLVNVIYFNGKWVNAFDTSDTSPRPFHLDDTQTVKVPTMFMEKELNYGDLQELNAKVLELPYADSDLSMLIFLPKSSNGLANLEEKLQSISLKKITERMENVSVTVFIPKFKIEFKSELGAPLINMGVQLLFSSNAELGKILKDNTNLSVSNVIHKVVIDVNESGTEAAGATLGVLGNRFGNDDTNLFEANVPFHYVIKNKNDVVFFKGSVKQIV